MSHSFSDDTQEPLQKDIFKVPSAIRSPVAPPKSMKGAFYHHIIPTASARKVLPEKLTVQEYRLLEQFAYDTWQTSGWSQSCLFSHQRLDCLQESLDRSGDHLMRRHRCSQRLTHVKATLLPQEWEILTKITVEMDSFPALAKRFQFSSPHEGVRTLKHIAAKMKKVLAPVWPPKTP